MAIHELATNAAKYGSLSVETGSLSVAWAAADGVVSITWIERGGPRVMPSSSTGFGMTLLNRTVKESLGGTLCLHWRRAGLRCELSFPLVRA
jgi:two-component sensor histidine kinase